MIIAEEEELIAQHGPTDRAAILVLLIDPAFPGNEAIRVQQGIAQELKSRAVESVAAGFCDNADAATAVIPIFCVKVTGEYAKFRNRIEVRNDSRAHSEPLHGIGIVHFEPVGVLALSINGEGPWTQVSGRIQQTCSGSVDGVRCDGCGRRHAGLEREQIGEASAIQRHRGHFLVADHFSCLRIGNINVRGRFVHGYRIGSSTNGERDIEKQCAIGVENDV